MLHLLLRSFTFSNVCSFLALTIALGTGTAYAANTIGSEDIIDNSIQSVDLKNAQVKSVDLQTGGVANVDLANNLINSAKVSNNTLTTADLAGADVNGGSISIPAGYVPNGRCRQLDASVVGAKAGEGVIFSTKAALQDGIVLYGQRVPSDGHVTFSVCNFSGTTQAAMNGIPVRVITFG